MKDDYLNTAQKYDRLFESMNQGLRVAGLRMFRPSKGMNVLDVGCGTGAQLKLYQSYGCNLYGIDCSPSMLEVARGQLGDSARLDLGDATCLPYEGRHFDLVICMLTLHEMAPLTRAAVLAEVKRVLKENGHLLLIDFHTGPYQGFQGWKANTIIRLSEFAAGSENYQNYRQFMKAQGLPAIALSNGLVLEKQEILAWGTIAILLVSPLRTEPVPVT